VVAWSYDRDFIYVFKEQGRSSADLQKFLSRKNVMYNRATDS
jgi:hypothetical protein